MHKKQNVLNSKNSSARLSVYSDVSAQFYVAVALDEEGSYTRQATCPEPHADIAR